MKSEQEKRVLVVTPSADTGRLYIEVMLKSASYISQTCIDTSRVLDLVDNFSPHLVIWHLNSLEFEAALEILSKIQQIYDEHQRPLILLVVPTDWSNSRVKTVVDAILEFIPEQEHFLQVVEDLLQKKSP